MSCLMYIACTSNNKLGIVDWDRWRQDTDIWMLIKSSKQNNIH